MRNVSSPNVHVGLHCETPSYRYGKVTNRRSAPPNLYLSCLKRKLKLTMTAISSAPQSADGPTTSW